MNKKVIIGLGVAALIGYFLYAQSKKKKPQVAAKPAMPTAAPAAKAKIFADDKKVAPPAQSTVAAPVQEIPFQTKPNVVVQSQPIIEPVPAPEPVHQRMTLETIQEQIYYVKPPVTVDSAWSIQPSYIINERVANIPDKY